MGSSAECPFPVDHFRARVVRTPPHRLRAGTVAGVAGAGPTDEAVSFDASQAVVHGNGHSALTPPSGAKPGLVVGGYLRGAGRSVATLATVRETTSGRSAATGLVHARFEQVVGGLTVAGAYARAALTERGELVHVIDSLVDVKGAVAPASSTEAAALAAALDQLHPGVVAPRPVGRSGNVTTFVREAFFHSAPTVERVAIAMTSGALHEGFRVTTWSERGNLLNVSLVSGSGRVLAVELRTAEDSYNIFAIDPEVSPQTVVSGAEGWLGAGSQSTVDISGNNAHAYLDRNADNAPDRGHNGHRRQFPRDSRFRCRPDGGDQPGGVRPEPLLLEQRDPRPARPARVHRERGQLPGRRW